jgi:hypothetical protein
MSSIIKRDLLTTKRYKYTFFIFLIYLFYFLLQYFFMKSLFKEGTLNVLTRTIGINYNCVHFLDILVIILTIIYIIFLTLSIYLDDLSSGKEQILLRISRKKYVVSKLLSIIIYIFISNFILYILFVLMFMLFKYNVNYNFLLRLFLIDSLLKVIYSYLCLIIYHFINILITTLILMLIPICALLKLPFQTLYAYQNMNNLWFLLLTFSIIFIISALVLTKRIDTLFLKEEKNEI